EEYQRVLPQFTETLCAECNKTRSMPSWSQLSTPAMALRAGSAFDKTYVIGFAIPTQFIHSSIWSVKYRALERDREGKPTFKIGSQREEADQAAHAAHAVMLQLLDALNECFQWKIDQDLDEAQAKYLLCWNKPPGTHPVTEA